jgi:uncharacterized protein YutE (UPF0331/DUF86 family)
MRSSCYRMPACSTRRSPHMARMMGFRNVAVHDSQRLSLDIVQAIILERLDDFRAFGRVALEQARRQR